MYSIIPIDKRAYSMVGHRRYRGRVRERVRQITALGIGEMSQIWLIVMVMNK